MTFDDHQYQDHSLREKDDEINRLTNQIQEGEAKLSNVLGEFTTFRAKAQEMIIEKDEELNKFKGRSPDGKTPEEI